MRRLEDRWDRRQGASEPLRIQVEISVAAPREAVWTFLNAPEASLITSDGVVKLFPVPDTPLRQEGEQWVVIFEADGLLVPQIHEIVVFEPLERLVYRSLTSPFQHWWGYFCEDVEGGTRVTSQVGMTIASLDAQAVARECEAKLWEELRRAKRAIESGVRFESQGGRHGES